MMLKAVPAWLGHRDGKHRRAHRIDIARHDGLQRENDMRRRHHGSSPT